MDGNSSLHECRVALLQGGESAEREISLASGQQVAIALALAGHEPVLIDPAEIDLAAVDWESFDVCFIALHGGAGEDGLIQQALERLRIPYTGSGPTASHLAMDKWVTKARFEQHSVPTPRGVAFSAAEFCAGGDADVVISGGRLQQQVVSMGFPLMIKPQKQGSSLGISVAAGPSDLALCVAQAAEFDDSILAERFVEGREYTISLLGRDPLPMIEIISPQQMFTYDAKYSSVETEYRLDTGLPAAVEAELYRTALEAAEALDTAGLVRVDLMLDRKHRPWVLEVNTIPGMTARSLAPRAARAAGIEMPTLVDWMLRDALQRWQHPFDKKYVRGNEPILVGRHTVDWKRFGEKKQKAVA